MIKTRSMLILVSIIILAGGGWFVAHAFTSPHGSDTTTKSFVVQEGWGVTTIAAELKTADLISSPFFFKSYVWLEGASNSLQAGSYDLSSSMSIKDVVTVLSGGQTLSNERVIKLTEGWTSIQIADYLQQQGVVTKDDYLAAVAATDSRTIIPDTTYGILGSKPASADLEGFLFPDTYRVFRDATAADIVKRQLDTFQEKIDSDMQDAIAASGHTFYEILTLASIVEKEVRTNRDRALAADIFWRRLEAGMALQADSTVNYITGKTTPSVSLSDTEIDSPYNTYKYQGLPPGPISNPSLASIKAAVYPEANIYWYFLTKPDGTTVFSKNYEEHLENKNLYLK